MPIVQLRQDGEVIKSVTMQTPVKVHSIPHWGKEALKALRMPLDLVGSLAVTVTSPKAIVLELPDSIVIEIDRTKDQMGQPKRY